MDTVEAARKRARELLDSGEVAGVIGMKEELGNTGMALMGKDDIDRLVVSPKYPIAKLCRFLARVEGERRYAVVVRGCDERALIEMNKRHQLDIERFELVGIACDAEEARDCGCLRPYPSRIDAGEKIEGVEPPVVDVPEDTGERLAFWRREFSKCLKCYGCRNACPMCFCDECMLEEQEWTQTARLPPDYLTFHLIWLYHIADKCIQCRECEKACPVGIPLGTLRVQLLGDIRELFDFTPGDPDKPDPLITTLEDMPINEKGGGH